GDYDRNIKIVCKEHSSRGNHKEIGTFYTTVRILMMGPTLENHYWLVNEYRRNKCSIFGCGRKNGGNNITYYKGGSMYKNSGEVRVNKAYVRQVFSFLDYIKGGTEISTFIAIDFTASNGEPDSPKSLHFINTSSPNQYTRAIQTVGEIIQEYDTDKFFAVLGFGAKMPPEYNDVSHEFFVNGDPTNPFCYRIE
ncbi:unnamed protein product, partial [Meganyctiphanes norvegica]